MFFFTNYFIYQFFCICEYYAKFIVCDLFYFLVITLQARKSIFFNKFFWQ